MSLALLISSLFIYNSIGTIDESALDRISFIANLSRLVQVNSNNQNDGQQQQLKQSNSVIDLAPYFPRFIWLLRDFNLKLVDNNNDPITPKQYLELALAQRTTDETKNNIRKVLQTVFIERDCFTLIRPVEDEDALQELDSTPYEQLREKFKTGMEEVKRNILKQAPVKKIFDKPISGSGFVQLVQSYVDSINGGTVPVIKSAWETVSETESINAVEIGVKSYLNEMSPLTEKFPMEVEELEEEHNYALELAEKDFEKRALGVGKEKYLDKLRSRIKQEFETLVKKKRKIK